MWQRYDGVLRPGRAVESLLHSRSSLTLRVRDLEASIAFYRKVLGFQLISHREDPQGHSRLACLVRYQWGSALQLYQDLRCQEPGDQNLGGVSLVVQVADPRSTSALAAAYRGKCIPSAQTAASAADVSGGFARDCTLVHSERGARAEIIADPDGYPIELVKKVRQSSWSLLRDPLWLPLLWLLPKLFEILRNKELQTVTYLEEPTGQPAALRARDILDPS